MSITIAMISADTEYVTRMLSYMKGSPIYHTWRLQLYSTPERIHGLNELTQIELIVVEEALYSLLVRRLEAGGSHVDGNVFTGKQREKGIPLIVLASTRRQLQEHELYKFQSVSALLHGMQQRYERFRSGAVKQLFGHGDKPQTIAVCSTLEQAGKTVLALHAAALLADKGYRVFYCNLEMWNTSEDMLQEPGELKHASCSDLLYLVKSKQTVGKWLAEHGMPANGYRFYMLRPFQHEADRRGLAADDAQKLVAAISESGLYDYVIVDLPAGINSWTLPLLQQCDMHYMILLPQLAWQRKHQLALACAESQADDGMSKLGHKRRLIMNQLHENCDPAALASFSLLECLPYVEQWRLKTPDLLSAVDYRAAMERCIKPLLDSRE